MMKTIFEDDEFFDSPSTPQKSLNLPKKKRTSNQFEESKEEPKETDNEADKEKEIEKGESSEAAADEKDSDTDASKESNFNMNSLKEEYCFKFNTLLFCLKIVKFC